MHKKIEHRSKLTKYKEKDLFKFKNVAATFQQLFSNAVLTAYCGCCSRKKNVAGTLAGRCCPLLRKIAR